ncbi:MAG TPA: Wzz/FepE/Etk N-terminal domain-containing protein [Acidobacteriaceae bacterium]|nr:Wzz/FepE/Etk N-terminal domain-containing protein [Acidobacteriaceae bacterium]
MSTFSELETGSATVDNGKGSIDVLELVLLLVRHRRRIALVTLISLVIGAAIAFLMRPVYTAKALILPPQQQQSSASTLLSSLSLLGGGVPGGLLKTPADMYVGILESDTIADNIIHRFHLQSVYKERTLYDTRATLAKHADFETRKDGLIHISVTDHDPERASEMANAYIDELYHMNSTLAITEAAQRRLFFQQQVGEEKTALAKAEDALAQTQEKTGIIQLNGQADIILRSIAQVQAQITSDQVQLEGLLASSTEQNPDVQRLRQEISALRNQLSELQNRQGPMQPGSTQIPTRRLPKDALDYMRKLRDVRYHETLFDLLSKQYEAARIDEAKSAPLIQVVDRAIPPDKRSGPPRTLITLAFGTVGFVLACLWGLGADAIKKMSVLPEYQEKFARLRASWHKPR